MAPAATPRTAKLDLSWNHPVMATRVQYMQKVLGRKAVDKEQEKVSGEEEEGEEEHLRRRPTCRGAEHPGAQNQEG